MQLNVSQWLHDGFAPARRPKQIIRNAKRQAFLCSIAIQEHCIMPV